MKKELKHILLIDDDEATNFLHELLLKSLFPEVQITLAWNGQEAIDFLKAVKNSEDLPDLIFLDINMPVMDGWEFLEEYDALSKDFHKSVVAFMVTSSLNKEDQATADKSPCIDLFLPKPITEENLEEVCKQFFGMLNGIRQ